MKIIYFTRDYTPHDHRFLDALAKTRHKVYYLRLERRGIQLEDRPLPPGIEAIPWEGGQHPATLRDGPRLLLGLRRVLKEVKPDVLHAGPIQSAGLLAALSGFRPIVAVSWGSDLLRDAYQDRWHRLATRFVLRRSAVLVGDCKAVRMAAREFGMPDDRIITFPWGVDLQHFQPPNGTVEPTFFPDSESDRPFVLLSTRGWEQIYGVEILARAFIQAALRRPDLHLVMLGGGSQGPLLRRLFQESHLEERVSMPGQVSRGELPRYYQAADLYVSASRSDGTSISLLEALATGTPALVSDIPGNREWVQPEEHGWLFRDGDTIGLAQGILEAYTERERLEEMGRKARELAERRADWDKNFPKLLEAYEMALQKRRRRG